MLVPLLALMLSLMTFHDARSGPLEAASGLPLTISPPRFQSAENCRACHSQIYDEWKRSWMAKAYTHKMFQTANEGWKAYAKDKPNLDPAACLRCHAPLALLTNDREVKTALSQEGVSCDVCHTIAGVKKEQGKWSFVFDPSGIKYGARPIAAATPAHETRYSAALRTAEICAGCHFDADAKGMPLEWTYREWRESSYPERGIFCQDCHMRLAQANPLGASSGAEKTPRISHAFEGGHSTSTLLKGAVTIRIIPQNDAHQIQVELINSGVGHNFPTKGAHPNQLILTLTGKDEAGAVIHEDKRVYALTNLNAQGKPATPAEPVASLQDTTLKPLETRIETFAVASLEKVRTMEVVLRYHLIPDWLGKQLDEHEYHTHYRPIVVDQSSLSF